LNKFANRERLTFLLSYLIVKNCWDKLDVSSFIALMEKYCNSEKLLNNNISTIFYEQCAEHCQFHLAADLITDACIREKITKEQVILHSDNGSPMKSATMLAKLQDLGIMPSFSRPSVSDNNPYSESLFRTLKYRPEYPEKPFANLYEAREWANDFVNWYNTEHLHSGINFVTPEDRHNGRDTEILINRHSVYQAARLKHPERWSVKTRNWIPVTEVVLKRFQKAKQSTTDIKKAA